MLRYLPLIRMTLYSQDVLRMKTEGRTLPQQVWYYPFDRLTFRRELSPSLRRSLSCPSFTQTAAPPRLRTHRHLLKGSNVLVLLQEVQNSAVSAPFRIVNTTCHHSSGHQKEKADTSRPHYFAVLKHLDIRSLQCSKGVTSLTPVGANHHKGLLTFHVDLVYSHSFSHSYQTLGDGVGGADIRGFKHVNTVSGLSPAFRSVEKWQQCHPVTIQVMHTTL